MSPWSSNSASSCPSSVEIKEFFYDDDLIDTADWTLGRHVSLHDDTSMSSLPQSSTGTSAVIEGSAATASVLTIKPNDSAADKTLTAGMLVVIARDSRKSRQKWLKMRHTFVKIAKITAKSRQFI